MVISKLKSLFFIILFGSLFITSINVVILFNLEKQKDREVISNAEKIKDLYSRVHEPEFKYSLKSIEEDYYIGQSIIELWSNEELFFETGINIYEIDTLNQNDYYYEVVFDLPDKEQSIEQDVIFEVDNIKINDQVEFNKTEKFDQDINFEYIKPFERSNISFGKLALDNTLRLPASFSSPRLVFIDTFGIPGNKGVKLDIVAAIALKKMVKDLTIEGIDIYATSGYRSFQSQLYTYNYISSTEGEEAANTRVARPGYSEHQTGLSIDLVNEETDLKLPNKNQTTRLYDWLQNNAHKYGFRQTFTGEGEIEEEIWHWTFVGAGETK